MNKRLNILVAFLAAVLSLGIMPDDLRGSEEPSPHAEMSDPLELKEAVIQSLQANFGLKAERMAVPAGGEQVIADEAVFDPVLELGVGAEKRKSPTGVVFYENPYDEAEKIGADAGIRKKFETGLMARLGVETFRAENNFVADSLDPNYRTVLMLNLTQPIMKGFGTDINTTEVHRSENRARQAFFAYVDAAQTLAERTEAAYRDLAHAQAALKYRIHSRQLARELVSANQERFDNGMASITEVTEAKTAAVDRDENVSRARMQMQIASNLLKDLMEIGPEHPLFSRDIFVRPLPEADVSVPELESAIAAALENRADLKNLRLTLENQELLLAFLKNQKLPKVDLVGSFGVSGLAGGDRPVHLFGLSKSSPYIGDYSDSLSSLAEDDGYQWSAALRLEYPLGNRAAEAEHARGRYHKRSLEYLIKRTEGKIRTEVKNAHVSATRNLARVTKAKRFVNLAQKTLDQETARLREGLSTTFRILDHQENLVAANLRHVAALADFHKSIAALHRATATNLDRFDIVLERPDDR